MEVSLLGYDQIFGKNALNTIKIFGRKVGASDLAALQGAHINANGVKDPSGNYTANAWTATKRAIPPETDRTVTCVSYYGDEFGLNPKNTHGLIRPVLISYSCPTIKEHASVVNRKLVGATFTLEDALPVVQPVKESRAVNPTKEIIDFFIVNSSLSLISSPPRLY